MIIPKKIKEKEDKKYKGAVERNNSTTTTTKGVKKNVNLVNS
jgi:hypothetical protein